MKRPFALIGFTAFAVTLALACAGRSDITFCAFIGFTLLTGVAVFSGKSRQDMRLPLGLFAAALSCLLFLSVSNDKEFVQSLTGDNVYVEAVVCEAPYRKSNTKRHYAVCELKSVGGEKVKGKLRLSFSPGEDDIDADALQPGNSISFRGKVYIPGENDKSIERYFFAENILLGAYSAKDVSIIEPDVRGVNYRFYRLRVFVTDTVARAFPDKTAGVLVGILTGDKSCLDGELYKAFRKSGIAHLMAVSGLHLSVWVFFTGAMIPENSPLKKLRYILLILLTVFIMLLSGMSESVKRAGFMAIVHLSAGMFSRRSDGINNLGLAALLMIIYNPACVLSVSFQLSFLATLAILTLGKAYMKKGEKIFGGKEINTLPRKLMRLCFDSFCVSISVLIFTFPVLIVSFGGISTVSAFVNLLLIPVTTPVLVLTGFYVLIYPFSAVSYPVGFAVKAITDYIIAVSKGFSQLDNSFIAFKSENLPLYLAGALLVILFSVLLLKSNLRKRALTVSVTLVISAVLIVCYEVGNEGMTVQLGKVGDEAVCVFQKDNKAVLYGELPSYEKSLLESQLEEKGAALSAELKKGKTLSLKNSADGKRIFNGCESGEIFDGVTAEIFGDGIRVIYGENNICVFTSEHLQQLADCDIIIEIQNEGEKGFFIKSGEKTFSSEKEGRLTLVLKKYSGYAVRGEYSWRNLMKSN